jgi:hypothetical protein
VVALGTITKGELEIVVMEAVKPGKLVFSGTSTKLGSTSSTVLGVGASVELLDEGDWALLDFEDMTVLDESDEGDCEVVRGLLLDTEVTEVGAGV